MDDGALQSVTQEQRDYLCLIQSVIDRMSTTSSIIKGFTATVITGIAALTLTTIDKWILLFSFLPILSFFALDLYYLKTERKFRFLYELVRTNKVQCDFSLKLEVKDYHAKRSAKTTLWQCLCSPSIWLFYAPVCIVVIFVCVMKFSNMIC